VIGGIEVLLDQLLPALRDRGHDVTLLTSAVVGDQPETDERLGIPIHRTRLAVALTRRDLGLLSRERQRVKRLVEQLQPDVIHAHDIGPNLWAVVKAAPAAPIITTLHIGYHSAGIGSVAAAADLLRVSAWVTGVSAASIAEALTMEPSLAGRTSVIENGVPIPAPSDRRVVTGRILCVGRLVPQKGFDSVVRALALIADRHPRAHVVFAGDGAERGMLETLTKELSLGERVTFLGAVGHAEIAGLLAEAQVVALPSRWEGQPIAALETAAAGRPLVSTAVDGLASTVVDGVTGLVVAPDDPPALAAALDRLLGNPAWCDELGANARDRVQATFGLARCVDAYAALYERIVTNAQ
jgi:glycogen(starch) synthase